MQQLTFEDDIGTLAADYRMSGDEMMAKALEWIGAHPDGWRVIVNEVRAVVARGGEMSLRTLVDYHVVYGMQVSVPHALTAPMQRILAQTVPNYSKHFRMSRSKVDE